MRYDKNHIVKPFYFVYVLSLGSKIRYLVSVATVGLSCWCGDDTKRCWLPSEAGKWSCSCKCLPTELHSADSVKDLISVISLFCHMLLGNVCKKNI